MKSLEVALTDGLHYVPAFVSVNQDGTVNSGDAITLAQMQSLGLATQSTLSTVLAELQLKANLAQTQPVSIATAPALVPSTAVIGKVGIDQTINKTTNAVYPLSTATEVSGGAIARPSNATPYTAGDVKGATAAAFEITGLGSANQSVRLVKGVILINVASIPSGMTNFTLKLYNATPVSALADNAPWTAIGDALIYQGEIVFGNAVVFGTYLRAEALEITTDVKLSATGSLFAYLVTNGSFTPTSGATTTTLLTAVGL